MQRSFILKTCVFSFLILSFASSASECAVSGSTRKTAVDSIWNRGMALLDSGRLSEGLRLTDSISGHLENDSSRMIQYIRKIFQTFLLSGSAADSALHFKEAGSINDSLNLSTFNCRIGSSNGKKNVLPNFTFNFIFPVEKPYHLIFKGLKNVAPPRLKMNGREIDDLLSDEIVSQSLFRQDSISCTIFIDADKQIISIYDYIAAFAQGVYDSIAMKKDLKKYHALSLRGYSRAWDVENGRFTAVVAFDKPLKDRKAKKGVVEPLSVRYTIIVKSNVSVCDYAEVKLQKILRIF
jgi:hypothetical protein